MMILSPDNFVDIPNVLHIELGARCGDFGRNFFAPCFLTDMDESWREACSSFLLDRFCSAEQIPWPSNRFHLVILCNPYDFGFKDRDAAFVLLNELGRASVNGGKILILASKTNL